ncbi:hypothetical protein V1525DRAFT_460029 [Lipomyces kononenkoae]|uniref:Uncharacterized protein n=1 Tax=Lipomyces kononenkoae TaxID=34357 RepID=A0ACC3SQS3_LIPKO
MFVSHDGRPLKSCKTCRDNRASKRGGRPMKRTGYDLDGHYDTHDAFIEGLSSFLEQHDDHKFDLATQSLRIRAALSTNTFVETDVSMTDRAQTDDRALQKRAAMLLRNDIFDCTGYYVQSRRCTERNDEIKFSFTCSCSTERETERDPLKVQRYTIAKEFFDCQGRLHITISKNNGTKLYRYAQVPFSAADISDLTPMADDSQFEKTDLHTITRKQVYNVWLSFTRMQWEVTVPVPILSEADINSHNGEKLTALKTLKSELSRLSTFLETVKDEQIVRVAKRDIEDLLTECLAHKRRCVDVLTCQNPLAVSDADY